MEKTLTPTSNCPCCSDQPYSKCCEPLLKGKSKAKTAEDLLRSRYTAFVVGNIDYIMATHHSRTVGEVKRNELEEWSRDASWMGLKLLQAEGGTDLDDKATLVFHAQYELDGKVQDHFEKSFFEKENGVWKFLDAHGIQNGPYVREEPKIGRNDPCHCGSGKKFKKCHAA
jgi:SEC-C motif-containing protein